MTLLRTALMSGLVLAFCAGAAQAAPASGGKMMTLQMPATPEPARVTLDPKTTALMVLDYVEDICNNQASCKTKMLPAMTPFMAKVRQAGLTVAYGTRAQNMTKWLKEVAPAPNGIKTLIMVGWKISGSVTYTSVGAMAHDYTVVIPVDTTSAGSDYETTIGFYNVLNSGNANLANEPLKPNAVTLTRTDMIAFQ